MFIYDVLRDACICGVTTIPSSELGSGLLCVTGDEPEVLAQRTEEFEVIVVTMLSCHLRWLAMV